MYEIMEFYWAHILSYSILYNLGTLKSLIDEETGISEQTGIFFRIFINEQVGI